MATVYILFALYTYGESNSAWQQEFNSHGACLMALNEGKRIHIFDNGMCTPKG